MSPRFRRLLLLAAAAGCQFPEMEPEQACLEAGYAVAARTLACTGDTELANERARALFDAYPCALDALPEDTGDAARHFSCARAINEAGCEEVLASGDDMAWWLGLSPSCRAIFEGAGPAAAP